MRSLDFFLLARRITFFDLDLSWYEHELYIGWKLNQIQLYVKGTPWSEYRINTSSFEPTLPHWDIHLPVHSMFNSACDIITSISLVFKTPHQIKNYQTFLSPIGLGSRAFQMLNFPQSTLLAIKVPNKRINWSSRPAVFENQVVHTGMGIVIPVLAVLFCTTLLDFARENRTCK